VALDTSGYAPAEVFRRLAEKVDLVLFDLKLMDDRLHKKYTAVSNKIILQNFQLLESLGKPVWVRFPLITGVNDDDRILSHGFFSERT